MTESEPNNTELFATVDGTAYPLSNDECVFRARTSGEKHVMTLQVLKAMDLCSTFRTMAGHVQAVMRGIPELKGREQDVRRVITSLKKHGLMVTSAQSMAELRDASAEEPVAPLSGLFVRSSGRPKALERLLESIKRNGTGANGSPPCYVLDDGKELKSVEQCRVACERWREAGLEVRWLDRAWQQTFADNLALRSGIDPGLVRWLLTEAEGTFTGGRLWNLALLASAGRRMLMLDDDMVCEARQWHDAGGVELGAQHWELWFHADAAGAAHSGHALDIDPLAAHVDMLGAPLPSVLGAVGTADELARGQDQRQLQALHGAPPVIATNSGMFGDAASTSNHWYFTQSDDSLERLWQSRQAYETNSRTRWVTRVRARHSLQFLTHFTPVGLDASRLLPPTLPAGRNEDFLFTVLLHRLHPRARILEFPWALGHFPEGERRWQRDALKEPVTENLTKFLADSLLNFEDRLPGAGPELRLKLAADQLCALASESSRALESRLDEYLLYDRSDMIRELQGQLLAHAKAPIYWVADVQSIIKANGKALTSSDPPRLAGLETSEDDASGIGELRRETARFAEALAAWPTLWEAAGEEDPLG